ncbi:MAG: phage major capsid protein [Planctomycetota bacterium]
MPLDTETKQMLDEMSGRVKKIDTIEGALTQLEESQKGLPGLIDKKLATVRSMIGDDRHGYRGIFTDERQAAAFACITLRSAPGEIGDKADAYLKREFPDLHQRVMDTTTSGSLIPHEMSTRVQALFESFGVFEAESFPMPMGSASLSFSEQLTDPEVYILEEGEDSDEDEPTFGTINLNPKTWTVCIIWPKQLEEDALPALGELIARSVTRAMAEKLDEVGFTGTADKASFGIRGVAPALQAIDANPANVPGLVLGSGNAWDELTLGDHEEVVATLPQYADSNAKWYCHRRYFGTVMMRRMLEQGGVTAAEVQGRRELLFLGYPVRVVQKMPKAEANSQVPVVFGDLRMASTIGNRRQLTMETSEHAQFKKRQMTLLATRRLAVNVHDVGDAEEAGPMVGLVTAPA